MKRIFFVTFLIASPRFQGFKAKFPAIPVGVKTQAADLANRFNKLEPLTKIGIVATTGAAAGLGVKASYDLNKSHNVKNLSLTYLRRASNDGQRCNTISVERLKKIEDLLSIPVESA